MKRNGSKFKGAASGNLKIYDFFPQLTPCVKASHSASSISCNKTPERPAKRKRSNENTNSPDIIPSSIDSRQLTSYDRFLDPISPSSKSIFRCRSQEELCEIVVTPDIFVSPVKSPSKPSGSKSKRKVSPAKKLFERSPFKLHTFNQPLLESFVQKSPRQLTLTASPVQRQNERTPTKHESPSRAAKNSDMVKSRLAFDDLEFLDDDVFTDASLNVHTLDLSEPKYCQVLRIERTTRDVTLTLESLDDKSTALCVIAGFWTNMRFAPNDTLFVTATNDRSNSVWRVTNKTGLIVFEPHHLVSTTSVVGALFCLRRSILNEKYRGFEPSNRAMIVGKLVHTLLQEVLRKKLFLVDRIGDVVRQLLAERETLWMCYDGSIDLSDVKREVQEFVPRIATFMRQYVKGETKTITKEDWCGKIDEIKDIEENIWCPELGIKGKIDVTVQCDSKIMPLELKTSRASVSLEHRGQVMLYVMMMNKFGYEAPSGLLLYLRENVLREIPASDKECRDLMLLRNEFTYFLTRKLTVDNKSEQLPNLLLPDPISHHSACAKCPYNRICSVYLSADGVKVSENEPLKEIQKETVTYLTSEHIQYFTHWSSLLELEAACTLGNKQVHEIYSLSPTEREKNGQSLIDMTIVACVAEHAGMFSHTFQKTSKQNLQTVGIGIGSYVVVSIDTRPAVAAGFVTDLSFATITIVLDRNLNIRYANKSFHLDTYSSNATQSFNMTSLTLLLESNDRANRLRQLIVDKQPPTFRNSLQKSVATQGIEILKNLNKWQQKAILKALSANDYLLIKGMPGTGKTATIVALIQILVALNKSVLITSHTHSAVDNVCVKLVENGMDILRLGSSNKIHPKLLNYTEMELTKNYKNLEELGKFYDTAKIIAVTCLGSGHAVLNKRVMDVCIIDESTQVLQTSLLRPLHCAKKFILVGDPNQLPPVVKSRDALVRGLGVSLFERLDTPTATVTLHLNYRMNQPITDMANNLTYDGQLQTASDKIARATLSLPNGLPDSMPAWIAKALHPTLDGAVRLLDTGPVWKWDNDTGCVNLRECRIVAVLLETLLAAGVAPQTIGVIAPYRDQVTRISLDVPNSDIEVSTVDQFQGRDKDIVIYSCTRSYRQRTLGSSVEFEILEDKRRLTVAVTRAKYKFVLIGDLETVRKYTPFRRLLNSTSERYFVTLQDDSDGFSWAKILNSE